MTIKPRLSQDYVAIVHREHCTDGTLTWAAYYPDLPGCLSDGETAEEAVANLADAGELYLEDLARRGILAPAPGSSWIARAIAETAPSH